MCAVDNRLETPKFSQRLARERSVLNCRVHLAPPGVPVVLPVGGEFDLPLARLDNKYTFCRWLVLASEKDASCFDDEFFHLQRSVCSVSKLIMNEVNAWPSLSADFKNDTKG